MKIQSITGDLDVEIRDLEACTVFKDGCGDIAMVLDDTEQDRPDEVVAVVLYSRDEDTASGFRFGYRKDTLVKPFPDATLHLNA